MEVKINKEIREYTEGIFLGLLDFKEWMLNRLLYVRYAHYWLNSIIWYLNHKIYITNI